MRQAPGPGRAATGIVYDTGLRRVADALALALLHGFDGKNEARLISVSVGVNNLNAAAYSDAVGQFYLGRSLPIGMAADGKPADDLPLFAAPLARGGHSIRKLNDTADPVALVRNALTAQVDGTAVVILSGPATTLARVLALRGSSDVIAHKVKFLALAVGAYPDGPPDPYLQADAAAAQRLLAEWPGQVVACGSEVGNALPFPAASIEKDFAWSPAHPIAAAFRAYRAMPYDASTEPMAAALYAARPAGNYLHLSDPGTIRVMTDGSTKFMPSPDGKHRYLILDQAQKDRIIQIYTEVSSAKPVPRTRPRPQP